MPFFQRSEGATVNGGTFVDINGSSNVIHVGPDLRKGEGIRLLLDSYVQREAIHDSSARGALGCHPGTREEYIRSITSWGSGEWDSEKRALLMTGPAGAGKSAIARTCAHRIQAAGNFGASFFFFRPTGWNDPKKFIPTIVYQLTTRYSAYRDCIDAVILGDPLVLEKAIDIQFRELLIEPLLELSSGGHGMRKDMVIVVDGLDECATVDAQVQIVDLVATSIREQTTPFLWAFFSRPEPPITSAFSSKIAMSTSWKLPLTLSGDADSDIEAYLHGSFEAIRAKYNIPASVWPKEEDIHRLVSQSAGLFVYAVTVIKYIDGLGYGASGIEERLRAVLELNSRSTESPLSALDQLYMLVMMQIPEGVLSNTMSLFHLCQFKEFQIDRCDPYPVKNPASLHSCCVALGLSSAEFHVATSNLYSVLEVTISPSGEPAQFQFYHKSFLDFLLDPKRSKQYFIQSLGVRQHSLEMIVRTLGPVGDGDASDIRAINALVLQAFFILVQEQDRQLGSNILQQISRVPWSLLDIEHPNVYEINFKLFIQKIPISWRRTIVRPSRKGLSGILLKILVMLMPRLYEAKAYILGKGDKKCLMMRRSDGYWRMR